MGIQQYSLVSGDWINLEAIINDLARSVGQELSSISEPTFAELTLTGLTASRLVASDADKQLESTDLTDWVAGTDNQVEVADDGDGSLTLSLSDDLIITDLTTEGTIDASAGKVLVEDNDTIAPTSESDGYIGVAKVGANARIYFAVDGNIYYTSGSFDVAVQTGNPIGLGLLFTYP